MAQNASYGMGQYRYDENFEYYTLLETIKNNSTIKKILNNYITNIDLSSDTITGLNKTLEAINTEKENIIIIKDILNKYITNIDLSSDTITGLNKTLEAINTEKDTIITIRDILNKYTNIDLTNINVTELNTTLETINDDSNDISTISDIISNYINSSETIIDLSDNTITGLDTSLETINTEKDIIITINILIRKYTTNIDLSSDAIAGLDTTLKTINAEKDIIITINILIREYTKNINLTNINISELNTTLKTINSDNDDNNKIAYTDYSPKNDDVIYRDITIKLPCDSQEKSLIKYGEVYYIKLKLPKNSIYNTNFNLKLCTANNDGKINTNKFQQIQYLTLSSTNSNNNYSTVVLFKYGNAVKADIPKNYIEGEATANQLYIKDDAYGYCILSESDVNQWNTDHFSFITEDYTEYNLLQDWKANNSSESSGNNNFDNFDFIFSPKYNLSEDYKYLWIENIHTNDEYVKTSNANQIYTGNMIVKDDIECSIYKVANLLAKDQYGIAPIKSGTTNLNAITAIGPAGLILAINGEDIRIGTSGQYQLEDFDINFLGAILGEDFEDKFTIDYTYAIES